MLCLLRLFQQKMFSKKHFLKSDLFSCVWLQSWKWLYNIFCCLVCTEKSLICFVIPNNCWTKTLLHKSRSKWEDISYFLGHRGCLNGGKKNPTFRIYMKNYVGKRLVGERQSFGKCQQSIYAERKGTKIS